MEYVTEQQPLCLLPKQAHELQPKIDEPTHYHPKTREERGGGPQHALRRCGLPGPEDVPVVAHSWYRECAGPRLILIDTAWPGRKFLNYTKVKSV